MSTLTKEWLLKTIAELEEERDAVPGAVNEDAANALAAMKLALASLETEAVAWIVHARTGDELTTDGGYVANAEGILGLHSTPLYTAPPAPVSDSLLSELLAIAKKAADAADECAHAEWSNDSMEHSTAIADWERRAAMLQGADGNSPVIPDGACPCCGRKQLKNRTCSVSGCDGKHVAHGFCKKHYDIERKKDPSRRESIRAADKRYRARKAVVPQQEVR